MDAGSSVGDDTTSRELVHFITQQTRFSLISDILAHPQQLPSMYELEELNPSVSDATVYKHIQKLIDAGIITEVALDDDQRRQGYPWKFYGLTEDGREFLETHNLLAAEETLQQIYDTIADKPEKMSSTRTRPVQIRSGCQRIGSDSLLLVPEVSPTDRLHGRSRSAQDQILRLRVEAHREHRRERRRCGKDDR